MTEYPEELVGKVRSNRDAYNDLLQAKLEFDRELGSARITYEVARKQRSLGERVGGWAVRLVKKSTPTLQRMWDAEVDIERLEGLLETNSANRDAVTAETDSTISSYLAGTSGLFQEYLAGKETVARAVGESQGYLSLVSRVKEDVDYLAWMVWRDWPYLRDPWRRPCPPRRCPPPGRWDAQMQLLENEESSMGIRGDDEIGIMGFIDDNGEIDFVKDDGDMTPPGDDGASFFGLGTGLGDDDSRDSANRERKGDDAPIDIGFGLYNPKVPDFSPPDRRRPHPPRRPCPPHGRPWHDYWLRRHWALQEAQEGINAVKAGKPGYVSAMKQYASGRSQHLDEMPVEWHTSLSAISASSVDDIPWYSAFAALPFMLAMDRVSSQLAPITENAGRINSFLTSDLSQLESRIAGEVANVKSEILND